MAQIKNYLNRIFCGNCLDVMKQIPDQSIDLIVTDPPYLVNYRSRENKSIDNDDPYNSKWLKPAYAEMYRVLKPNRFCVSFYGYTQAEKFVIAWKSAGFRIMEHFVWQKKYASSFGYVARYHEQAYLLAKGKPDYLTLQKPKYTYAAQANNDNAV